MNATAKKKTTIKNKGTLTKRNLKVQMVKNNDTSIDYQQELIERYGFTSAKAAELANEIKRSERQNKARNERSK